MKKQILALVATLTACLSLLAGTNMCVKLEDGQIVKFDVNRVLEVYYEAYIHPDTNHIVPPFIDPSIADTSAYAPLRFEITSDSTVELTSGDSWDSYEGLDSVNIPAKVRIDGKIYDVTSIGNEAFAWCESLTSIVIPESVTSIGNEAFAYCDLFFIDIPESVTSIGDYAFSGCSGLTSINIPEGVTSIGDGAFSKCDNLTSINIPEGVTSIDWAFYGCRSLTSIVIPESVTSIGERAFAGCQLLTSIVIPESVTSIGNEAFAECLLLTSINIPEGVTSIGERAFDACQHLTSIVIPESVTTIGEEAFAYCENLDIEIENSKENVKFIMGWNGLETTMEESHAFDGVKSVTWKKDMDSSSVADTSAYAPLRFQITSDSTVELTSEYSYRSLDSVNIPAKVRIDGKIYDVTSIGDEAFYGCGNLESVDIPESVTSIGDRAFSKCGLTSIVLPNSVTGIGNEAFGGSGHLTSINIPESVTTICNGAFGGCGNLTSIVIPESVTSIGERAFASCENLDIEIENTEENVKFMGWNGQETTMEGSGAFKGVKSVTWKK